MRTNGLLLSARQGRLRTDLREYCELRQLYDAHQWTQLPTARLERYFDLKQTLAGTADAVFTAWQEQGDRAVVRAAEETRVVFPERFETLILAHSYAAVEGVRSLR